MPVVEIEQPLLLAPEVSDLARHTKFDFIMDGMVLTLLGEEEDPLAVCSLCDCVTPLLTSATVVFRISC